MKRFFAILLSAMLLTACAEKGEGDVEEITATEAVAEELTIVTTEETTASATETKAEETAAETTAETEESTTAEKTIPETIIGTWIENRGYVYEFREDGSLLIDTTTYKVNGKYEMNGDNLVISLTDTEGKVEEYSFNSAAVEGGYDLKYIPVENDDGYCLPYEPAGIMSGYFSALGGNDDFSLVYPNEMPRRAQQEDLIGAWINHEYAEITIIDENSITYLGLGTPETYECQIINGEMTGEDIEYDEEYPEIYTVWNDCYFVNYLGAANAYEKYDYPQLINEFFSGKYEVRIDDRYGKLTVENGKGVLEMYFEDDRNVEIIVSDEKIEFNYDGNTEEYFEWYVIDNYIYFIDGDSCMLLEKDE